MRPKVTPFGRLLAASLLMDGSFYLVLTAAPLRAIDLRATPLILGLMPVLGSGVYIGAAYFFGRLSDRGPRMRMARVGAWLRVGAALGLTQAGSVGALLAWMPIFGMANALFWPGLQASIGEAWPERDLGRNLGGFNVCWSGGKMLGFLFGGIMVSRFGFEVALLSAAGATAVAAILLPSLQVAEGSSCSVPEVPPEVASIRDPENTKRRAFRQVGWLSNFVLFGIGATLNYQYPKLMLTLGFTVRDFGLYLGAIYFFQTVSFILLRFWSGWMYRITPLLLTQATALIAVSLLSGLRSLPLILATAPGIGLGLGMSYTSSLYYSLHQETGRGRNTGIHEALLGSGTFVLPLLGGAAAEISGSLLAPYGLCAAALGGAMLVETWLIRRNRDRPRPIGARGRGNGHSAG